jgi:pimeloyl-ACP methyl ester carboxylesterase
MGEFVVRIVDAFRLQKPHVVAPDIGTPAVLFAAANHPDVFASLVIGSGATDHTDIKGVLDLVVNAPSFESFKEMTGAQFVRGAVSNLAHYRLPDYALDDYLASYAGSRFFESVEFVRDYPRSLPRLAQRLHRIDVPVQLTVGRDDPFVPVSNAEKVNKALPNSRLNVLDCGHFVWEDAAEEYVRIAIEFIRKEST